MKKYTWKPLESIGHIIFSDNRENIRSLLGEYTEFKKTEFSKNTTDDFGYCQIFYDTENNCEAVEFSVNATIIVYSDTFLTDLNFEEAKKFLQARDEKIEISTDNITSKALGIAVYAPNGEVESLLFFRKGYFD